MLCHLLSFSIGISTGIILSLISKPFIVEQQKNWTKLNSLVAVNHKYKINMYRVSIIMLLQSWYLNILQYLNSTIKKIKHNKYELTYNINGKIYKLLINIKKGPRTITSIYQDHGEVMDMDRKICYNHTENLNDEILPFLGPCENFHGIIYTPKMFNKTSITFRMSNGKEFSFWNDTPIIL